MSQKTKSNKSDSSSKGKLKIGDNWNAIKIIALSQNNPLKAIAEFVENSIDAKAKRITIIRGKNKNEQFLKIIDDGEGISDFAYVATHIGDSIKRQLKKGGIQGLQGEFGIGLLSFWTVGEELTITSTGITNETNRMKLVKNNPGYSVSRVNTLFQLTGTELLIKPLLSGIRQLNGEKIQNYLASELRDRINKSRVEIKIIDRTARKELLVEPRKFTGRILHSLPEIKSPFGDIYFELYLTEPSSNNNIGLYRLGTRVLPSITSIDLFNAFPWNSGYLEGIIDVSFLQLTPGTRDGFVYDDSFESFAHSIDPLGEAIAVIVNEQKSAEDEHASFNMLKKIRRALKEALLKLPQEIYNWLDIQGQTKESMIKSGDGYKYGENNSEDQNNDKLNSDSNSTGVLGFQENDKHGEIKEQKAFFDFPGPLYNAIIVPSKAIIGVNETKKFSLIARDKNRRQIDSNLKIKWRIKEGEGKINNADSEIIEFTASNEPGLSIIEAAVFQDLNSCAAESIITVTENLVALKSRKDGVVNKKGLPGYTYRKAAGETWRSKYDADNYIIIINNAHADFIYASRNNSRKIKYIANLFVKELILANFPEASREELLERIIELTLYMDENLR